MSAQTLGRPGRATAGPGWGALVLLVTGVFITTLDFFVVNVAVPAIQSGLHAGAAGAQFVIAGYGLAFAAGLITGGRLGDLFGRRRVFGFGIAVFTVASAVCGLAPDTGVLIAARVVQGAAAALLSPQVLALISTLYTGARRAPAFNAFGLALGFGAVFGQLIGGLLIQADVAGTGWRGIFLINVPLGVAVLLLLRRLVPPGTPSGPAAGRARLDLTGTVLISAGLVAVVLPLVEGRQLGWPGWTWACLAAAVPLLLAFARRQRRAAAPLVAPALVRERAFTVGVLSFCVYALAMSSFFLVLALYLQSGRGLTPLGSGLVFLPLGAGYFGSSLRAAAVAARLGRQVLAVGALGVAAGYLLLGATAAATGTTGPVLWLVPGLLVAGAGMGLVMSPLPSIVLARVAPEHASAASGVLSAAQQAGAAIGVALVGLVFYPALAAHPGPAGYAPAFAVSTGLLAGFGVVVAVLVQLLPSGRAGR